MKRNITVGDMFADLVHSLDGNTYSLIIEPNLEAPLTPVERKIKVLRLAGSLCNTKIQMRTSAGFMNNESFIYLLWSLLSESGEYQIDKNESYLIHHQFDTKNFQTLITFDNSRPHLSTVVSDCTFWNSGIIYLYF